MPTRFVVTTVLLLSSTLAVAQIHTGGKGGGLPGGGPGPTPGGSTGGRTPPGEALLHHVLERVTYGATADDLASIRHIGVDAFLELQLRPDQIVENPVLFAKLAELPPAVNELGENQWDWQFLYADYLLRARYSRRQLLEIMAEFWQNHFSTNVAGQISRNLGQHSSLAFDPATGEPAVGYYFTSSGNATFNRSPFLAYRSGGDWTNTFLGNIPAIGRYLSLAFDPINGDVLATYYDERAGDLLLRRQGPPDSNTVVDGAGDVGLWTSLAVDPSGVISIAYYDRANGDLRFARANGPGYDIETVDANFDVGMHASLALDAAGRPAIAYYDASNGDLRYASKATGTWQYATVASIGDVGAWCSLALHPVSGQPSISYHDRTTGQVKLASLVGAVWQSATVGVGDQTSLAFEPATGDPAVAYRASAGYDLTYAIRRGAAWVTTTVAPGPNVTGTWPSLRFTPLSGLPMIAYHDSTELESWLASYSGTAWSLELASWFADDGRVSWELAELDGFRTHAFGRFRDLLAVSAHSPGMMIYLNNNTNVAGSGNENYARELLELHTLGVDGGYSQTDVEEVARALTGWSTTENILRSNCEVLLGDFCYNHDGHDGRARRVLGVDLPADSAASPANYMRQGEAVLDLLARHPATATFVCTKLLRKFVSDQPEEGLVRDCAATFLASDGDIGDVLASIFTSREFRDPASFRVKVRNPLEHAVAAVRHLEGDTDGLSLYWDISEMGLLPFQFDLPTGYDEGGLEWISPAHMINRWRFAERLTQSSIVRTSVDPYSLVLDTGVTSADGVVQLFVSRLLGGEAASLDRALYADCVSNGNPATFDLAHPATPARLREMVAVMLGAPGAWKQ